MTGWCVANREVPDSQFGFFPDHHTLQPMFVLRHLIYAARRRNDNKRVFTAFIDFSQAYDTVYRGEPWSHLEAIGMPAPLMRIVRDMYAGDAYELVDGDKRTGEIRSA